ncbi:hypothetical protein IE81DRAFT_364383 [Ceraceosorus guamensis]|uniref:Uncharacterized protein n=1 Tax=Ceraceosorus guamensis TaxID=1522189 RepID=A0A316WAK0_9BASI|nr:hypothetical protein IE81DRAFT_364383 [Ceraceosorus guamensis]PWN44993.1 hypothetical protein IE81DRAFT_364383 [Ceraceosorus guamensis]
MPQSAARLSANEPQPSQSQNDSRYSQRSAGEAHQSASQLSSSMSEQLQRETQALLHSSESLGTLLQSQTSCIPDLVDWRLPAHSPLPLTDSFSHSSSGIPDAHNAHSQSSFGPSSQAPSYLACSLAPLNTLDGSQSQSSNQLAGLPQSSTAASQSALASVKASDLRKLIFSETHRHLVAFGERLDGVARDMTAHQTQLTHAQREAWTSAKEDIAALATHAKSKGPADGGGVSSRKEADPAALRALKKEVSTGFADLHDLLAEVQKSVKIHATALKKSNKHEQSLKEILQNQRNQQLRDESIQATLHDIQLALQNISQTQAAQSDAFAPLASFRGLAALLTALPAQLNHHVDQIRSVARSDLAVVPPASTELRSASYARPDSIPPEVFKNRASAATGKSTLPKAGDAVSDRSKGITATSPGAFRSVGLDPSISRQQPRRLSRRATSVVLVRHQKLLEASSSKSRNEENTPIKPLSSTPRDVQISSSKKRRIVLSEDENDAQ